MDIKPLPPTTYEHFNRLHTIALQDVDTPIDVTGINPSCIRAMYTRGLIDYEFITVNDKHTRHILFTKRGLDYGKHELALVPEASSDNRERETLKIYLDMNRDDHQEAWGIARSLAGERILTPTIVDLLIMHSEFLHQDTATLEEAYPGVYKLLTETKHENLLSKLEALVQGAPQSHETTPKQGVAPPKGLTPIAGVKSLDVPDFDDDEDMALEVQKDAAAGDIAVNNFLKSVSNLQDN